MRSAEARPGTAGRFPRGDVLRAAALATYRESQAALNRVGGDDLQRRLDALDRSLLDALEDIDKAEGTR